MPPPMVTPSGQGFIPPPPPRGSRTPSIQPPPPPPQSTSSRTSAPPPAPQFENLNQFQGQLPPPTYADSKNAGRESAKPSEDLQPYDWHPKNKWQFGPWLSQWIPVSIKETPSWLVSFVVHVAIILLLALIPIGIQMGNRFSVTVGLSDVDGGGGDLAVFDTEPMGVEDTSDNALSEMQEIAIHDLALSDKGPLLNDINVQVPMNIRSGLKGRSGALKDSLLKSYGGTAGTENAVQAGLEWLARNQRSDGSWSLVGPYNQGGVNENKPAATAMALLALMGAGNTHQSGTYKDNVARGFKWLIKQQNQDGFFAKQAAGNQVTYAQAQCSIAICELYGMTGDSEIREAAQRSVRYAERSQSPGGGWRYQPRESGDTSVTGWYVMALVSARMAGLDVDSETLDRVHHFLDSVQREGRDRNVSTSGERYAYQAYTTATPAMTAEGMLCRLYLGWDTKDPRIERGIELMIDNPIAKESDRVSFYYWYYATTTLHHVGGPAWFEWNGAMKEILPALQEDSGAERGSWSPENDPHGGSGGRLYSTCFALYCLESYYRHLPLSDMAPKSNPPSKKIQ